MTLVSFRLLRKNLGNLRKFLGEWFTAPPGKKIARTHEEYVSAISKEDERGID